MTDTKHTPGPWHCVQPDHAHGWWVVSTDLEGCDCVDDSGDGGFTEANAHLIAAAPDLLEALREAADPVSGYLHGPALDRARAAIAKAEGRE